jgi:hypothetical protein
MEQVQFALPTLSAAEMPWDDQARVALNQATAVIISAWLAHANTVLMHGPADNLDQAGNHVNLELGNLRRNWALTSAELINLMKVFQIC